MARSHVTSSQLARRAASKSESVSSTDREILSSLVASSPAASPEYGSGQTRPVLDALAAVDALIGAPS